MNMAAVQNRIDFSGRTALILSTPLQKKDQENFGDGCDLTRDFRTSRI